YVLTHLIAYLTNIQKLYSCVYTKLLTVSIKSKNFKIIFINLIYQYQVHLTYVYIELTLQNF
ncbi:hypothetical protein, partial [Streptococcus iniae]|uniref:hypothetical protein n=1 Tax=Streptococcus iniae TaxID=1346 RepID=UPI001C7D00AF